MQLSSAKKDARITCLVANHRGLTQKLRRSTAYAESLEKKIKELESELTTATRDYVLVRHAAGKEVNEANLEAATATRRAEELLKQFQAFSEKAHGDVDAAAKAVHDRDRLIMQSTTASHVRCVRP